MTKKWYDSNLPKIIFVVMKYETIVGYFASKKDAYAYAKKNKCGRVLDVQHLTLRNEIECPKCKYVIKTSRKLTDVISCWKCKYSWRVLVKCKECSALATVKNGMRICTNGHKIKII